MRMFCLILGVVILMQNICPLSYPDPFSSAPYWFAPAHGLFARVPPHPGDAVVLLLFILVDGPAQDRVAITRVMVK